MSRKSRSNPKPHTQGNKQAQPPATQPKQGTNVQRAKVEYDTVTLNHKALKDLESSTVGSLLELVNKVILIDGKPYKQVTYINANGKERNIKLTTGRKSDFLRLIESYAIIEFIGIKCHIVKVFDDSDREKLGEFLLQRRIEKMKYT